jgi:hypothetical protein
VRRARKSIFDPVAMDRELRMAQIVATTGAAGAGGMPPIASAAGPASAPTAGYDSRSDALKSGRRVKLFPAHATAAEGVEAAVAAARATPAAPGGPPGGDGPQTTSLLPDFFVFRTVNTTRGNFGYLRIHSFMTYDAAAFVAEFARIAALLSQEGLIVDVRRNGGGNIIAGEQALQVLSPQPIVPERFHFINTLLTRQLCEDPSLQAWFGSIDLALQTGETYSQGFPLTTTNPGVAYRYPGKRVLIVDALCYSTTDIFAAGFQDHNLGRILGTSGRTGAGGANVWPYEFFQGLPGFGGLPQGVNFRTAVRRSTRVGPRAGVPLEDLGVVPDQQHRMTRRDILENNADLIEHAAQLL